MWDVVRFAELARDPIVLVENVVDVTRGEAYEAWLSARRSFGYRSRGVNRHAMFC